MRLEFTVLDKPQPQGSIKAFHGRAGAIKLTSDNASLKAFRGQVTLWARRAIGDLGMPEPMWGKHIPVRITRMTFFFVRPPSVSASARPHMVVKPDIDKLQRAVFDALSGFAYADDAQIVRICEIEKVYSEATGVRVVLESL
jgi:Holliday junction resolvase RusA-like endonuclease